MDNFVTIRQFIYNLWESFFSPVENLLSYAHHKGWIEDQDEVQQKELLTKRTAARILHQFMLIELKIPDSEDFKKSEVLKDLYTCRICVKHVEQVYIRNLMDAEEFEDSETKKPVLLFNMTKTITQKEAQAIIQKTKELKAILQ